MRFHFPDGLPLETAAALASGMCRPEGTVRFKATFPRLHDPAEADGILMLVITGAHVFRVRRVDAGRRVVAEHSTPGTGTRSATMGLDVVAPSEQLDLWLSWSPEEVRLNIYVQPDGPLLGSIASAAEFDLWVADSGELVEVGSPGIEVMGLTVYAQSGQLVSPPARWSWDEMKTACDTLLTAADSDPPDHLLRVIASNASLSMLVTGFEVYSRKRFRELDAEGVAPDLSGLVRTFGPREERDQLEAASTPAILMNPKPLLELIDRINFQSYDRAKRAWNRGYGIKFGDDLGLTSDALDRLQRLLDYRHRIIHISPMIGFLNQPTSPPETPEFSGIEFARRAVAAIDEFIHALHAATLNLRPADDEASAQAS